MTDNKNTMHTPGPWYAQSNGEITAKAAYCHEPVIAKAYSLHQAIPVDYPMGCQDANARLIASAPDLLAYAECSAALDCEKADPAYDAQPVLRSHGWNGQENPGLFLSRIRRNAIEAATGAYLGRAV
jgi:hypothetical protein